MLVDSSSTDPVTLTRYLLGQLPTASADEVEDRFVVDDLYFALYEEVERNLICDYAARLLNSSDAALFEKNYLVTDERKREVTVVRALLLVSAEARVVASSQYAPVKKVGLGLAAAALVAGVAFVYWGQRRPLPAPAVVARKEPADNLTQRQIPAPPFFRNISPQQNANESSVRSSTPLQGRPKVAQTQNPKVLQKSYVAPVGSIRESLGASRQVLGERDRNTASIETQDSVPSSGSNQTTKATPAVTTGTRAASAGFAHFTTSGVPVQSRGPLELLEQKLKSQYSLTQPTTVRTATETAGSTFVLKKYSLLLSGAASTSLYQNTYIDGKMSHGPDIVVQHLTGMFPSLPGPNRTFPSGEKLLLTSIDVRSDGMTLGLLSDGNQAGRYKGLLKFSFPHGRIPSPEEAQKTIAEILESQPVSVDKDGSSRPFVSIAKSVDAEQTTATLSATVPSIELGQTPAQVVAALGPPNRIMTSTAKLIYIYEEMQVTFVEGKIVDVRIFASKPTNLPIGVPSKIGVIPENPRQQGVPKPASKKTTAHAASTTPSPKK